MSDEEDCGRGGKWAQMAQNLIKFTSLSHWSPILLLDTE